MSKLSPSSALILGRALVVAGGLLVPLTLLQAPEGVDEVSLVLGAVMLVLVVLVVLPLGILRQPVVLRRPRARWCASSLCPGRRVSLRHRSHGGL